jgi:DNA (cytosine-5)-methyltransferase 1
MLTHFSLFTGIGGIDLAAEWAGFTTVGQCELAEYPCRVLCKHWPHVPKWRDIRDVTAESVRAAGIHDITLISGGFPCQPYSIAGKRLGEKDDRHLWPEMRRVIEELRPRWILGENVAHFVHMGLDNALTDLEAGGYEAWAVVLPACAVGAPSRRNRVFIVAYSDEQRCDAGQNETGMAGQTPAGGQKAGSWVLGHFRGRSGRIWAAPESCFERVDYGIPTELDRLRALGNAVNPQQVYPILKIIADIERNDVKG